jgi:hypothetical protein
MIRNEKDNRLEQLDPIKNVRREKISAGMRNTANTF